MNTRRVEDLRTADGERYTTLRAHFESYLKWSTGQKSDLPPDFLELLEVFFYGGASTMGILMAQATARQDTAAMRALMADIQTTRAKWRAD